MKRFFNKRAIPTLVMIALSFGAFAVCHASGRGGDSTQAPQSTGKADGEGTSTPFNLGGKRDILPVLDSEALQQQMENDVAQSASASRPTYWSICDLFMHGRFNVKTISSLSKRDPKTKKLIPGEKTTVFVKDELISLQTTSEKDGYLYVFAVGADDDISLLYPADVKNNDGKVIESLEETDNTVRAGETVDIPRVGVKIRTTAPFGSEVLLTIVTNKKIKSEKLRELLKSGNAADTISVEAINACAKKVVAEFDGSGEGSIIDQSAPVQNNPENKPSEKVAFEYGVHCLYIDTFETEAEREQFLSSTRTIFVGIGINVYKTSVPDLTSCVNDVTALAELLQKQGAVKKSDVVLITDKDATVENIKYLFTTFLPARLRKGDRVIIHWSSHGVTKDNNMYFVTYDAEKHNFETMLSSDDLNNWAAKMDDKKLLFIFDACYSGGAIDPEFNWAEGSKFAKSALSGTNLSIVTSSNPEETSAVRRDNKNFSLMTSVMIDYLDKHRDVDAIELGMSIEGDVDALAVEQFNRHQTVFYVQGKDGKFIINPTK